MKPALSDHPFATDAPDHNAGVQRLSSSSLRPDPAVLWQLSGRAAPDAPFHSIRLPGQPFSIGRHQDNQLCLPNPTVSSKHAEILTVGANLLIRDLNSRNGTFVNGRRIQTEGLQSGDTLQFGTAVFSVHSESERSNCMTMAADVADHALAYVQFDRLLSEPALVPFFQPIVRLDTGTRVAYEVLARSKLTGLENPGAMFRVAAERNLEGELSELSRREGVRLGVSLGNVPLYLNTHPSELRSPNLLTSLERLREQHPFCPIVLELHEAAVTSSPLVAKLRSRLKDLNIRLAYDDFGAGQSRLLELVDAPPDVLKFDMNLIRGLPDASAERRDLVGSLVRMVLNLGIHPLAEGIETEREAIVCRSLGFELGQGYFFGRPAPCSTWLAAMSDPF